MSQHLVSVHEVEPKSAQLKELLSKAFVFGKKYNLKRSVTRIGDKSSHYKLHVNEHDIRNKIELQGDDFETESESNAVNINNLDEGNASIISSDVDISSDGEENKQSQADGITAKLFDWLISTDGGHLDKKTSNQHVKQLRRILRKIDPNENLSSLLDFSLLRDVFMKHAETTYVVGTIKSYLMSLQHFYSYLQADLPPEIPFNSDVVTQLKVRVQRWSSSYKKSTATRNWEKMEEDRTKIISSDKFRDFEKSQAAREAISLLGKLSGAHNIEITQSYYTLIRDFLLLEISIDNANRAGVLSNMTMSEWERAAREEDRFVIRVQKHKTFATHGPANIVLTKHLYNWIRLYINEVRPTVAKRNLPTSASSKQTVFLTWNGEQLQSSQINKAIKSIWKKGGMEGAIHSTLMRKGAVTVCHGQDKEIQAPLANLMAHNVSTASKYYLLNEKAKVSVKASQRLGEVMRIGIKKTDLSSSSSNNIQEEEQQEPSSTKQILSGKSLVKLPKEKDQMIDRVNRIFEDADHDSKSDEEELSMISPTTTRKSQLSYYHKVIFNEKQVQTVLRLFKDMTKTEPISRPVVIKRLANDQEGKKLAAAMSVSQIINRIKYERRQLKEKTLDN